MSTPTALSATPKGSRGSLENGCCASSPAFCEMVLQFVYSRDRSALEGESYQRHLQLLPRREADTEDQLVRIRGTISEREISPYLEYLCVSRSFSKLCVYATLLDVVVASEQYVYFQEDLLCTSGPSMQDAAYELLRTPFLRGWVNRSKKEGRRLLCSEGEQVHPKRCVMHAKAPPGRGLHAGEDLPSCTDEPGCSYCSYWRGSGCRCPIRQSRCPVCCGQSCWRRSSCPWASSSR